jgi:TolB-like protein/Tfp pilus assembly protein PilF
MSTEVKTEIELEIAHVLFIDTVGYSKLLINEQRESFEVLNRVVKGSDQFRTAEAAGKLLRLPTGDGMVLVFADNPEAPAQCALEISKALRDFPQLPLRMGIHSGPVSRVVDVNDRTNIAGAAINIAQRVMSFGDTGHILLSKRAADDLVEYRRWQPFLHEIGECEVKHGVKVFLVNFYSDEVGNPALPDRCKQWVSKAVPKPVFMGRHRIALISGGLIALIAAVLALYGISVRKSSVLGEHRPLPSENAIIPEKSIAVLPFDNLSDEKQNAYFADGVQDEILTNLAKVADLKVISRTSVMQYKNGLQRNLREIAKGLWVTHILEGTVQRIGDRVRVSAQLIDARTDTHVWAERYDRNLADVFAIESELAERIVAQLKSKLSVEEKTAIEQKPTSDLAAFDLYVRAKILIDKAVIDDRPDPNLFEAVRLLQQAVERDPSFALAYYQLAHAHDQIYWVGLDHTQARLALADSAIQSLHRLRADSGEAHLALAKHLYWGYLDYDGARQELALAQRALPNDPVLFLLTGYIDRRQGRWDESLRNMRRALDLDPRDLNILQQIFLTYKNLRRYGDAAATLERALKLTPTDPKIRVQRAGVDLDSRADTKSLHSTIQAILAERPEAAAMIADQWMLLAICERDAEGGAGASAALGPNSCGIEGVVFPRGWCDGRVASIRGDVAAAQAAFTAARAELKKSLRDQPSNGAALCALGMVDAALGNKKDAVHEGRRAVQLLPVGKDAIDGALLTEYLAAIYGLVGKKDDAFNQLAIAAKIPGHLSYGQLRLDPLWDPLRGDPRFEKIAALLAPK